MVEPGSKRIYFIDFEGGKTAMSQGIFKASRSWIKPGDAFFTRSSRRSPAMLTSWFQLRETCASEELELQPKQSKYLAFTSALIQSMRLAGIKKYVLNKMNSTVFASFGIFCPIGLLLVCILVFCVSCFFFKKERGRGRGRGGERERT